MPIITILFHLFHSYRSVVRYVFSGTHLIVLISRQLNYKAERVLICEVLSWREHVPRERAYIPDIY